ncbi:remorin-like isoform X3 [Rhodamnia argentea]|uniref:Remorin-like isoform X3 n=1 Tax=Rhodamnia argentea TaxID=178133 RepID=A0A8B8Q1E4_9MYRT|nr:remorin-like isoform X3 [Rhodamnia argentea]
MRREMTVTPPEGKSDESIALVAAPKAPGTARNKGSSGSVDRDLALAEVEKEKKLTFIKAWEESEKTKADNKAQKKMSTITSWENSKKAAKEADLRKTELEKKKAEYGEKVKNKVALIHKQAEEKRATIQAERSEQILKAGEVAAKYRAAGYMPKKFLGCF